MSIVGGPLVMTITDRQKCFEERKQLASHPCSVNHYITLGMVRLTYLDNCGAY